MLTSYPNCPKCDAKTQPFALRDYRCVECGHVCEPVKHVMKLRPIETDPRNYAAPGDAHG